MYEARTTLAAEGHPGAEALARCAELAGAELGWTPARRLAEIAEVEAELRRRRSHARARAATAITGVTDA